MPVCRLGVARLLFAFCVPCLSALPALAQQPAPESNAQRTVAATRLPDVSMVTLDGRLDEAFWSTLTPAADFIQVDPANGRPATERTEVRIAYDNNALYLGVTCFDSEPDKLIGFQRRRDQGLGSDDRFMWIIDTFLDGRTGYFFEMNPSGLIADSLLGINGENRQWDGIWNGKARRSEIGWTLEIEIPFRTLNFNPNSDTWGINFQRTVRRKNEESIWNGWARNQGLRRMNNAGLVSGISNVSQGRGLDIKPYGLLVSQASPGRGVTSTDIDASAGIDLFYNPTPLLRTNFTVNTDFAQTEVDQRQVNLTRFSLFFPERRDFFLDGATFFDFASANEQNNNQGQGNLDRILPFFSRRIGLSAANTPQKIDFGTKVTGQAGGQDIGLLHVRTGESDGFTSEDFTVARLKTRLFEQSYVGGIYTRRDPRNGSDPSHTAGLDARFSTSTFMGSENLVAALWMLYATQEESSSGNSAFGGSVMYPNDRWDARFEIAEVQENFDPDIGFVTRRGYRRFSPELDFLPRPANHPYIRQFEFGGTLDAKTDLQNDMLTRTIDFTLLQLNLHSGDMGSISANHNYERLDEPFEITDDITLPLGAEYNFARYGFWMQTANRRVLAVSMRYDAGDFYSGSREERVFNLTVRARPGLIVGFNGEWNSVELPEGNFSTRLYRLNLETQFTPYIALVNNVQFDSQSAVLGWQSRFRWILAPGNDLYVVYTHNWLDDAVRNRLSTLDRRAASKALYTYRF